MEVPDLAAAVLRLDELGLRPTVTPEARDRHSRVFLHRTYLEVAAGARAEWSASLFFVRFEDPHRLRSHLERAGIDYRFGEYEGVDGVWDDVELHAGSVPLPILVRRTRPADVARDWPPPLTSPHRCGAWQLSAVHLGVPSLREAVEAYRALLGPDAVSDAWSRSTGGVRIRLGAGEIVLFERPSSRTLGLVLGVRSLAAPHSALGGRLSGTADGVVWLDPRETSGLGLGFAAMGGHPR